MAELIKSRAKQPFKAKSRDLLSTSFTIVMALILGAVFLITIKPAPVTKPEPTAEPAKTAVKGAQETKTPAAQPVQEAKPSTAKDNAAVDVNSKELLAAVDQMEPMNLIRSGDIDGAIGEARRLIEKNKSDVKNLMCAGNVFIKAPDNPALNDEGYELLLSATKLCPKSEYVRINYARGLALSSKRHTDATRLYNDIIKDSKDSLPALELARIYLADLDEESAIKLLNSVLDKSQGKDIAAEKLLGVAMARSHDLDDGEGKGFREYKKAFAKEKDLGYPFDAQSLYESNGKSLPKTIAAQKELLSKKPDDVGAMMILSELLLINGNLDEAMKVAQEAKKKDQKNPEIYRLLLEIDYTIGKDEDAPFKDWMESLKLERVES